MNLSQAYLLGVLHGDGCINERVHKQPWNNKVYFYHYKRFVIDVKDEDFAVAVAKAFQRAYHVKYKVQYRRGYYWVESHKQSIVNDLASLDLKDLTSNKLKQAYLRGLFDSEGSVHCDPSLVNHVHHVVCYNSNLLLLNEAKNLLSTIRIASFIEKFQTAFGLVIRRKRDIQKYAQLIGFSIKRKRDKLNKIWFPRTDKRLDAWKYKIRCPNGRFMN